MTPGLGHQCVQLGQRFSLTNNVSSPGAIPSIALESLLPVAAPDSTRAVENGPIARDCLKSIMNPSTAFERSSPATRAPPVLAFSSTCA